MAKAQSNHITDEHYAAFGRIVNTMAEIDAVLDGIIVAMAKGTMEVLPLLPLCGRARARSTRRSTTRCRTGGK